MAPVQDRTSSVFAGQGSPLLQARTPASPARQARIERRISNHPPNWSLNDESGPQRDHRAPSLGDLHQELEAENEAAMVCLDVHNPLIYNSKLT